jgi:uncharacterized membrane protein SpoIIM required for sporulation
MIEEFVASRRAGWERLESLLTRARGQGGSKLTAAELEELGRGYRRVTSDLAIARRDFPQDRVARYLEQLAGRAHPVVYRREAAHWSEVKAFFTRGFPQAFRDALPYTAVAFLLVAIPFAATFLAVTIDPLLGRTMLPVDFADKVEQGQSWMQIQGAERSLAASMIMSNNIQVAFIAFAGGVLLGLGTVYVLVSNGFTLGAVAGMAATYGLGPDLGSFVAAHSGIELTVVFIAGGAGLRLGHSILSPGLLSRPAALSAAARQAIRLIFGCVPLLMIAGTLEGFVSPSALPFTAKLAVGATATIALYIYLLRPTGKIPL